VCVGGCVGIVLDCQCRLARHWLLAEHFIINDLNRIDQTKQTTTPFNVVYFIYLDLIVG
jgi:hypothetical protein